jgi:hypothetical protein
MRQLTYMLRFTRAATGDPIAATGQTTTTVIADGVSMTIEPGPGEASYVTTVTPDDDPSRFTEAGTITFGPAGGPDTLGFRTLGYGHLLGAGADPGMRQGMVLWAITGGGGAFEGAGGLVTSSFVVNPATGELRNDQAGTILLPD